MLKSITRRRFVQTSTGLLAVGAVPGAAAGDEGPTAPGAVREPAREIPVAEECDVVVCGAGPAGVTAAIAAARMGAKTRLIEMHGCLGGVWTAGLLCWILDAANKPGLMREIHNRLRERSTGQTYEGGGKIAYDPEIMKVLLEEMCLECGVKIQLFTLLADALVSEDGRLRHAVTESKSGRQAWGAGVFIDATGDGDLAARAGCGFDYGREDDGAVQPMSMLALASGIDPDSAGPFIRGVAEPAGHGDPKKNLFEELQRAGVTPSYAKPSFFPIHKDLYVLVANHEYGVCPFDAAEVTGAALGARAEVHRIVNALRGLGGPWSGLNIVATAEQIGVREGRRVHGHYRVSRVDLMSGARHEDAACRATFGVDVHATSKTGGTGGIERTGIRSVPYDIPMRALIARGVDGLMMAGRCISGDFIAHSSYRVTGNAVAMGQAAGIAAALAARNGQLPHEMPWNLIREHLDAFNSQTGDG